MRQTGTKPDPGQKQSGVKEMLKIRLFSRFSFFVSVKQGLMNEDEMFPNDDAEYKDERTRYYLPQIWSVKIIICRDRDVNVMASLYPWYELPRAIRRIPKKVSIPEEPEQKTPIKISVPWQALFFNPMLRG